MQHETKGKKCCIAIGSALHLAFAFVVGLLYAIWWGNANSIQNDAMDVCTGD